MGRPAGMPKPKYTVDTIRQQSTGKTYGSSHKRVALPPDQWFPIYGNPVHDKIVEHPGYDDDLICMCERYGEGTYEWKRYIDLYPEGTDRQALYAREEMTRIVNPKASETYHLHCLKPSWSAFTKVVHQCEGCDRWYVPAPEPGNYPVRYELCPDCE